MYKRQGESLSLVVRVEGEDEDEKKEARVFLDPKRDPLCKTLFSKKKTRRRARTISMKRFRLRKTMDDMNEIEDSSE